MFDFLFLKGETESRGLRGLVEELVTETPGLSDAPGSNAILMMSLNVGLSSGTFSAPKSS